jgi:hypothetical protein
VRHLVDEEEAIASILTAYKNGCDRLIDQLQETYSEKLQEYENQLQPIKQGLLEHFEAVLGRVNDGSDKIKRPPSTKELNRAVRKRRRLLDRLDDVVKEYEVRIAND